MRTRDVMGDRSYSEGEEDEGDIQEGVRHVHSNVDWLSLADDQGAPQKKTRHSLPTVLGPRRRRPRAVSRKRSASDPGMLFSTALVPGRRG